MKGNWLGTRQTGFWLIPASAVPILAVWQIRQATISETLAAR